MTKYQDYRSVKVTSPFGKDVLLLERFAGTEELSQLFHLDLSLYSEKGDLDADKILGKPLGLALTINESGPPRYFHGVVTEFAQTGYSERLHEYRAVVRPWFWLLTRTSDCRVFQGKSVPEIFASVCQTAGFHDFEKRLSGSYDPWEYCVQYRETDFNFLSRLLEQEGIFYFFEHTGEKHTLVLSDDVAKCTAVGGYDSVPFFPPSTTDAQRTRDHLESWLFQKSFHAGTYAARDYDYEHPATIPAGTSSISRGHNPSKFEIYDYPAEATKITSAGVDKVAKVRVQELQTAQMMARGHGDAAGLAVGKVFKLTGHPRSDMNMQYLVTSTSIEVSSDSYSSAGSSSSQFALSLEAADAREHYRPARITPKPLIHGTQTAVVVGPGGEEIYTDALGRVKVQFHWDRYGKSNEGSSIWVRVGQLWAGKQWGGIHIPRIGQEVIVAFMDGDPDDPLVIGSVYNGQNKPPYALPDNKTQSGIKSRSSLQGTDDNCNEFRFEDKKGSEMVLLHAEKDQTIEVEHDESHSVGHDKTYSVGNDRKKDVKANETTSIGKDRTESVGGSESVSVAKDRNLSVQGGDTSSIGKDYSLDVGGARTLSVAKDETINISGSRTDEVSKNEDVKISKNRTVDIGEKDALKVGKDLMIDAGDEVVIKSGSASLTMKKDGTITLKGADITLEGSGKITVKASSDVVLKGSKISQN